MNMDNIRIQLYHLLTKGALSKGNNIYNRNNNSVYINIIIFNIILYIFLGGTWGGDECSKHTSLSMHIIESSIWIASLIIMYLNNSINYLF